MSLVIAIKATDAIIVAADSRTTIGVPRGMVAFTDEQEKLIAFGHCALGISGSGDLGRSIFDALEKLGLAKPTNIDEGVAAIGAAAKLCNDWFKNIGPKDRPLAVFTLAGYRAAAAPPRPMVFQFSSHSHFTPELQGPYPAMAGASHYALYLSNRYHREGLNGDEAEVLAEYLIAETASLDPKVGGQVRMARVTLEHGFREVPKERVINIGRRRLSFNAKALELFHAQENNPEVVS